MVISKEDKILTESHHETTGYGMLKLLKHFSQKTLTKGCLM